MKMILNLATILTAICFCQIAMANGFEFAHGPYSKMKTVLEKTIFNVDVLTVNVQLDPKVQAKVKDLLEGRQYNDELSEKMAHILMASQNMKIVLTFLRDTDFNRFISEVKNSIRCAAEAGAISKSEQDNAFQNLPQWFAPIQKRGIRNGDSLSYHISENKMHTLLRLQNGKTVVDQTDAGGSPRRVLLGSYFAKCSDFRDGLFRSLISDN